MNTQPRAQSARQVLASVRAQHPQIAEKLHLASEPAGQLALFPAANPEQPKEVTLGRKDHDWDKQNPISKSCFDVVLFCKRCKVRMKLSRGSAPQYRKKEARGDGPAILVWSPIRPVCTPKETPYG